MSDETRTQNPKPSGGEPDQFNQTVSRSRNDADAVGTDPLTIAQGGAGRGAAESDAGARAGTAVPGYEVLGELGRGAMGVVYQARHTKLNRLVALKMTLGGRVDEKDLIRFLAEAEAVASVKHDNVVQVYDYGESGGRPYMALEYCSAGSLSERLRDGDPLGAREAAKLVGRIAAGVAAAHEAGIVHRDLKPGNILLQRKARKGKGDTRKGDTRKDDESVSRSGDATASDLDDLMPKVADFGLAKRGASELTATQAVMGTPSYMSPEQASGKTKFVGPQADVWALGVILFECLTGERPFAGKTTDEVLAQVLHGSVPTVRSVAPGVPRDLDLICRKCLEKNPADRYATAKELADDLGRFARGEPILARPLGVVATLVRWARRNPVVAGLLGMVALVTLGLFGSLYAQYLQAKAQVKTEIAAKDGAERERASAVLAQQSAVLAQQSAEHAAEQTLLREEAERQKAQADLAAARSAAEAAQANALVDLLNDLFKSSDPLALFFGDAAPALGAGGTQEGQAVVLGPFLRNAAARFRASLTDPGVALVRAKLLAGVGNGMKSIGLFAEAKPILEEALALRRAGLPDTHPDVWQSELDVGRMEAESGDFVPAVARFRKVAALQQKAGADPAAVFTTRFYEGITLNTAGLPEAGDVLKAVADGREKLQGKNHKDTLLAKIGLIAWFLEKGKMLEAMALFGQFREDMRALPDERIRTMFEPILDAQSNVAMVHLAGRSPFPGQLRKAADGLADDIARLEKLIPVDHLILCIFRYELAIARLELNEGAVADALFVRVLADARKTVGLSHPKTFLLLEAYAKRLAATGKVLDARKLYDEVEKANRDRFGPDNPWLTAILLKRARFELRQGDPKRALDAAKAAVELVKRGKFLTTVNGLHELFETAKAFGWGYATAEQRAAARALFAALRPTVEKVFGAKSEELLELLTSDGKQWYDGNDRAEADKRFAEALALLPVVPKVSADERLAVHYWCGRVALDAGRFADAEQHFRDAVKAAQSVRGYTQEDRRAWVEFQARALVGQGKFADAVSVFEEVRKMYPPKASDSNLAWADFEVATNQLAAGDRAAYAKTLGQMMTKYGKSPGLDVPLRLAWAGGLGGATSDGWDAVAFEPQLTAAIKSDLNFPWAWRGLALVRVRAGKLTEAEAALAKTGVPAHPLDYLIRGLVAVARKDFVRARQHLATAERLLAAQKPTAANPYPHATRVWHERTDAMILLTELKAALPTVQVAPPPREK